MRFLILTLLLVFASNTLHANEQELYDAVPPADSAFVRFINAQPKTDDLSAIIAGVTFNNLAYADVTPYAVIKQGVKKITFAEISQELEVTAGSYYTVVKNYDESLIVLDDALIENPAKAMIYFYNLSDINKASLFSSTHKADIFKNIEAGKSTAREINALTFGVTVKGNDKDIKTFDNIELKRRQGTSFVILGNENDYKAVVINSSIKK